MTPVLKSIFPFTQSVIAEYPIMTDSHISAKLENAKNAFPVWRKEGDTKRSKVLLNVASLLRQQKLELAKLITVEMGKLTKEAIAEIEKCASCCEYYASNASLFLRDELIEKDAIEKANQSPYRLGGSIWTKDVEKGVSLARAINTGAVFINTLVKSDPRLLLVE